MSIDKIRIFDILHKIIFCSDIGDLQSMFVRVISTPDWNLLLQMNLKITARHFALTSERRTPLPKEFGRG